MHKPITGTSMRRPVELITANAVHDFAQRSAAVPPEVIAHFQSLGLHNVLHEAAARAILTDIAQFAALPVVLKALAAAGAPCTLAEVGQRLDAARDVQAREAATTSDASTPQVAS